MIELNGVLALVASAISLLFLIQLAHQQRRRPMPANLSWLIGVASYAIGVGCQALAELGVLTDLLYRLWYLAGAFFAAAFLGMGSLYLVLPRSTASWTMRVLAWLAILVTPVVLTAPIDLAAVDRHLLSGVGFPEYVRLLTPPFNIFGTVGLVGVALWSLRSRGKLPWRRSVADRRGWAFGAIAAGALITASGATLMRLGVPGGFYVSQLGGIALLWLGFRLAAAGPRRIATAARPPGAMAGSASV